MAFKEFRNMFTWSISSHRRFQGCKRAYYWARYGYWDGWKNTAHKDKQKAYLLKNLQPYYAWRGDVLHRIIADYFNTPIDMRSATNWPKRLSELLEDEWAESLASVKKYKAGKPINTKKMKVIMEHFTDSTDKLPSSGALSRLLEDCAKFWSNFTKCDIIHTIESSHVLGVETMDEMQVEGVKVWVKMDLVFKNEAGQVVIVDWKFGNPTGADSKQLAIYALHASEKYGVPYENIRMVDVYMKQRPNVYEWHPAVTEEMVESLQRFMGRSMEEMAKYVVKKDLEKNIALPMAKFPRVSTDEFNRECQDCGFRGMCYEQE